MISPLVILPLVISPLCVLVFTPLSLDVRVATNYVKMMKMKKVARNKSSNFDSSILILLAVVHRMVFSSFSFFGIKELCRPCSCRRLARIVVVGLKSFLAFIGPAGRSSSLHANVMVRDVRDVDRRQVVQVSAICFCPSVDLLSISVLFILLPPDFNSVLIMFPCSSSGNHCFPTILLPLSFALLLALDRFIRARCTIKAWNLTLILCIVASSGRRQTPQEQT